MHLFALLALPFGWVGHAYLWTAVLNYVYARPYPKAILKPWRHFTGIVIIAFPFLPFTGAITGSDLAKEPAWIYVLICELLGSIAFPLVTIHRLIRKPPAIVLHESTTTLDLLKELGPEIVGDGKGRLAAKLPFNDIFKVGFTELTLAIPNLPPELDGLTILHLTDVHYHGTPSRAFHEHVMSEVAARWPNPDLVCLTGDYVDTDEHHTWIGPMLGRFKGRDGNFAILGNHDLLHHPEQVRKSLAEAGYTVLGNGWRTETIRGVPCLLVGHEGPWFSPPPVMTGTPNASFRLCLSHTPDNFHWGLKQSINLMLCGHVHGGQIRLPIIGSIFVPSVFGRRFDMGVFEVGGMAMVVGRGLSGKEPLRFRCHPQVILMKLVKRK